MPNGNDIVNDVAALIQKYANKASEPKKSGFFDLPATSTCRHPEHDPPSHISIPEGKGYRHVCPSCHKVVEIIPKHPTL